MQIAWGTRLCHASRALHEAQDFTPVVITNSLLEHTSTAEGDDNIVYRPSTLPDTRTEATQTWVADTCAFQEQPAPHLIPLPQSPASSSGSSAAAIEAFIDRHLGYRADDSDESDNYWEHHFLTEAGQIISGSDSELMDQAFMFGY